MPDSLKPSTILRDQPSKPSLAAHISSLLLQIAKLYQVPNFDETNALMLAKDTIERFKFEPIEVVIKCLENPPSTGEKNWRLTPDTIAQWMTIVLEKESELLEREHQKTKSKSIEFEVPQDITLETEKMIQEYINSLSDFKSVPKLTDGYINKNGQRKPKQHSKSAGYKIDGELEKKHDLHIQWVRDNYDSFTGKPKKEWVSEAEWLKAL